MKIEHRTWKPKGGWIPDAPHKWAEAQWVLIFGSPQALQTPAFYNDLRQAYPKAFLSGCSTAGEIFNDGVAEDSVAVTAVKFDKVQVRGQAFSLQSAAHSLAVGEEIARAFQTPGLSHLFVFAEGVHVNGSDLVEGISKHLPDQVSVTGGLAGDGTNFKTTYVVANAPAAPHRVAVVGIYGDGLRVGCGSAGGWDHFGPERLITRSQGNILYELDSRSALDLYKDYLGEHADKLPASGLLFPLSIRRPDEDTWVIRTIQAINNADKSITFFGNMPRGSYARFMRGNFDHLIDGASVAADACDGGPSPELALLVSCVGRKIVLKQRWEEELEVVRQVLGKRPVVTGFYSYGEISPFAPAGPCRLHNQTMSITTLSEEAEGVRR